MPKTSQTAAAKPVAVKPLAKGDHLFLVDGSGYIFRAYHALPPLNRKSDGLQVDAVLGFCNMLWKLLRDMPPENRPTHLAIIFDKSEITFAITFIPTTRRTGRRTGRPDPAIRLHPRGDARLQPALHRAGGFEADDLIATYVREAWELGATAYRLLRQGSDAAGHRR